MYAFIYFSDLLGVVHSFKFYMRITKTLIVGSGSTYSFDKGYASRANVSKLVSTSEYYSFPRPTAPIVVTGTDPDTERFLVFLFRVSMPILSTWPFASPAVAPLSGCF